MRANLVHLADEVLDGSSLQHHVEAPFGGQFLWALGHKRDLVRADVQRHARHVGGHRHLDVQLGGDRLSQKLEIAFLDVTAIASQVDGNSLRACHFRRNRGSYRLRLARLTRFTQRGDVIDVDR